MMVREFEKTVVLKESETDYKFQCGLCRALYVACARCLVSILCLVYKVTLHNGHFDAQNVLFKSRIENQNFPDIGM